LERIAHIELRSWRGSSEGARQPLDARAFAAVLVGAACLAALTASWLPLPVSVITVFLFAGPHNWFELRYFLQRLPVRFGKSRTFFLVAFAGIGLLTVSYLSLPLLYRIRPWPEDMWAGVLATWNTLVLFWIAALVKIREKQKLRRDWSWIIPVALALMSLNWLAPEMFSLALVYVHPLVALWFLDRHLRRTKPAWLPTYHRCLWLLPLLLGLVCWRLSGAPPLADDNGLAWRITQHAGAQLLPGMSSHLLVSVHVFLEMLHYGVWLLALPLIGSRGPLWEMRSVPLARHPRGFPKLVGMLLIAGAGLVLLLWAGFSLDYATTRDIYFSVAMAHVLAEAPFLLRMI
jgi:hypothetical protein